MVEPRALAPGLVAARHLEELLVEGLTGAGAVGARATHLLVHSKAQATSSSEEEEVYSHANLTAHLTKKAASKLAAELQPANMSEWITRAWLTGSNLVSSTPPWRKIRNGS